MKRLGFVIILITIMASLAIAACGGGNEDGTPTATRTPAATEAPGELPAGLRDILDRAASLEYLKYDMTMATPGLETVTVTFMMKMGHALKVDATNQELPSLSYIDMDSQKMCVYMPTADMAIPMDFSSAPPTATDYADKLKQYSPTIAGTETIDGKSCMVVQYTTGQGETRMWVWEQYGFPIRIENTGIEGTEVIELKNISFSPIPDSEFEMPAACQQAEGGN